MQGGGGNGDIPAEAMKGMVDGEKLSKEFMGANPYPAPPYPAPTIHNGVLSEV